METLEREVVEEVRQPLRWRSVVVAFAAVIAVVVGAGVIGWLIGSNSDPDATAGVPPEVMGLHDDVANALLAEDSSAFVEHFVEGGAWSDPHGTYYAPDSLRSHLDAGFPWVDFQELELDKAVYLGNPGNQLLAVEWTASGMSGDPAQEAEPFTTQITALFEIQGGKVSDGHTYFNEAELYNE